MKDDIRPAAEPAQSTDVNTNIVVPQNTEEPALTTEQLAAVDAMAIIPAVTGSDSKVKTSRIIKLHNRAKQFQMSWPPNKDTWLVIASFVLITGGVLGMFLLTHQKAPALADATHHKKVIKAPPKPTTVASTLSGLQVDPTVNQRPVTGVMIENSDFARPQSGLLQASVVFEAIAEGGITRFLALFQDTAPDDVGPIRSARPYYAQWALGFDAGYAHVGGSPEALANIRAWGVKDLDQFANGGSYHRISSREAPHNVYTAISTLNQLEAGKGYTSSTFSGFLRKAKEAPAKVPTAKAIDFAISGPDYNVHYDYNPVSNSYARNEGGAAHTDVTGAQLSPKVVIGLVMPYTLEADGYHSSYSTLGSGAAYIFQDGTVTIGNWTKPDNATQFSFTDAAGKPITLNPGQTWLTALKLASNVSYTP